ncbi:MAG: response regulator transcription factor [Chloroflexi bacterium]|nr:response regulator transcription factor [Chloroflexota bacterium]
MKDESSRPSEHPAHRRPAKILVVDDERSLVDLVRSYLEADGFVVSEAYDGPTALEVAAREEPQVVVLDVVLPGFDGFEVCRRLRHFSNAYVLMLTSKSQEIDKLIGLSVGADDYLTKPFSPRELVARVKAMLRRAEMGAAQGTAGASRLPPDIPPPVVFADLVIDAARHEVRKRGELIRLTPREFELLVTMSAHPGLVFTRNQLLNRIWGDEVFDERLVDVHMAGLRKKLEDDPATPRYIETIRGVGFRFGSRSVSSSPPSSSSQRFPSSAPADFLAAQDEKSNDAGAGEP